MTNPHPPQKTVLVVEYVYPNRRHFSFLYNMEGEWGDNPEKALDLHQDPLYIATALQFIRAHEAKPERILSKTPSSCRSVRVYPGILSSEPIQWPLPPRSVTSSKPS